MGAPRLWPACVALLVASLAPAAAARAAAGDWYLALGDSLAAGVQSAPSVNGGGYVDQLAADLRAVDPGIQLMNVSQSGATSSSLAGGQLTQAENFLQAHRGHVPYVTIDIGGNDVAECPVTDAACFDAGLANIDQNVPAIAAGLETAAGPETRFAMMTYYDPFLEFWVMGSTRRSSVGLTVANTIRLNQRLITDFGPPFLVADVAAAFSTADIGDLVRLPGHGTVPMDVAVICTFTSGCDQGFNIHANSLGHRLIADTFFAAFAGRAVLPSTVVPPSVSGRPRAGQTLSGIHGAWTGTPTSFRYRWERCDAAGLHCAVVAGASGWTYVVGRADAGDTLRVQEAAVNGAGTGAWATSAATQTVPRPVDPLANAIRAALLSALVPHRGSARVRAVLRTGGHGFSFRAPAAGLASFGWSARPARVGRTVLVARVRHRFRGPARVRLKLRLTRVGHSLLSRLRGGVRIIGLATYSRAGYEPVTVARRFILAR